MLYIRYADIEQLNNGKRIPPSGWKCEFENCDKDNNLWLNLTDGSIFCGRKFFDGTGGNGHANLYYNTTSMLFNFYLIIYLSFSFRF